MAWHNNFNIICWMTIIIFATGNVVVFTFITTSVKKIQMYKKCPHGKNCYRKFWGRQGMTMPNLPTLPPRNVEPVRGRHYDPHFGYEPYWPGGDWVFRTSTLNPNSTAGICNNDPTCNPIYKRYGPICGKNNNSEIKTFEDYCQMKTFDCHNRYGWHIIHRGKCRGPIKLHPVMTPRLHTTPPIHPSEAIYYQSRFFKRYTASHLEWRKLPSSYKFVTQSFHTHRFK